MERGSDKHAPDIDDQMKRESEALERGRPNGSRVEEARLTEEPSEEEPGGEHLSPTTGTPSATDLARFVQPSVYPADRETLLESARTMQAPDEVLGAYERLPADRVFENVHEVWETLTADAG